jgi:hypothetical protein
MTSIAQYIDRRMVACTAAGGRDRLRRLSVSVSVSVSGCKENEGDGRLAGFAAAAAAAIVLYCTVHHQPFLHPHLSFSFSCIISHFSDVLFWSSFLCSSYCLSSFIIFPCRLSFSFSFSFSLSLRRRRFPSTLFSFLCHSLILVLVLPRCIIGRRSQQARS